MKRNWLGWIGCQFRKHDFVPGRQDTLPDGNTQYAPIHCRRCGLTLRPPRPSVKFTPEQIAQIKQIAQAGQTVDESYSFIRESKDE